MEERKQTECDVDTAPNSTPGSGPLRITLQGSPTHSGFASRLILYGCFSSPRKPTHIFSLFHSFLCNKDRNLLSPLAHQGLFHFQPDLPLDPVKGLCFPAHSKPSCQDEMLTNIWQIWPSPAGCPVLAVQRGDCAGCADCAPASTDSQAARAHKQPSAGAASPGAGPGFVTLADGELFAVSKGGHRKGVCP